MMGRAPLIPPASFPQHPHIRIIAYGTISVPCVPLFGEEMLMQDIMRPSQRFARLLTPREAEIFDLVLLGKSNKDCAEALGISSRTVEVFRRRLMNKLHADNFAELMWLGILGQRPPADWDSDPLPHQNLRGADALHGEATNRSN